MQSAGPRDREREARLRRSGPRDDAVRPKRAELVDELQIVVEAWCRWSAGRAIEQPGADAVANLATAALLVGRVHRIDSEVVQIDLAPRIDQRQGRVRGSRHSHFRRRKTKTKAARPTLQVTNDDDGAV